MLKDNQILSDFSVNFRIHVNLGFHFLCCHGMFMYFINLISLDGRVIYINVYLSKSYHCIIQWDGMVVKFKYSKWAVLLVN